MSSPCPEMAQPFPAPDRELADAIDWLRRAAASPPETDSELRRVASLPRPWDPPSCPADLRRLIYLWLDKVVAWINEEYTWRVERTIPMCWVEHPHIVHELATLACLRWETTFALTPLPLEDWHRFTLPMFLDRIAQRVGTTGCPPGRHQPNPGGGRKALYREEPASSERRRRHSRDVGAAVVPHRLS